MKSLKGGLESGGRDGQRSDSVSLLKIKGNEKKWENIV